ncbi:hypothetical protein BKA70DRAFT_1239006 [Coprinopsis sp. MPI-PUGE-AT-0042]|nr:hypothetical protein BKA70DRAFT_1239006 [Coprinopsis sp. MPI-PUGE-AT-0042]
MHKGYKLNVYRAPCTAASLDRPYSVIRYYKEANIWMYANTMRILGSDSPEDRLRKGLEGESEFISLCLTVPVKLPQLAARYPIKDALYSEKQHGTAPNSSSIALSYLYSDLMTATECGGCRKAFDLAGETICVKCRLLSRHRRDSETYRQIMDWPQCVGCGDAFANMPLPSNGIQTCGSQTCESTGARASMQAAPVSTDKGL